MQPDLFLPQRRREDVCANRHRGADTSVLANARVRKATDRAMIHTAIADAGSYGITLSELCRKLNKRPNQISGRLTSLRLDGVIRIVGKRENPGGILERIYAVEGGHL